MPIVQCDASQLEWRTAVELSQDQTGLTEIIEGQDTHSLNEVAFSLPSRLVAKRYLFRTIFRGSGWAFANDPEFMHVSSSAKFWDGVNEKFYKKYDGLDAKHHHWMELTKAGQPIIGPLGREWLIELKPPAAGKEFKLPWTLVSNYPVQGTGADVMMIARISAYRRLLAARIPVKWICTIHDSLVVDCPSEYVQQVVNIFYEVFDDLQKNIKKLFGYEWVTPLACECKYGPNFKDQTKINRT